MDRNYTQPNTHIELQTTHNDVTYAHGRRTSRMFMNVT